jgi:hypothetical protein
MLKPASRSLAAAAAFLLAAPLSHAQTSAPPTKLAPVITTASPLLEDQAVDDTGRPDWTSARRFPSTRVYLQDGPGEMSFEQWMRLRDFNDGTKQTRFQEEVEIGLPYRFQMDLYETWTADEHRTVRQDETSVELRYALADWGKIPLNPTLYAEYARVSGDADTVEVKLLLGQDLAPRLHYGFNFAFEQGVTLAHTSAYTLSQGLSYTIIDQVLSAGVEMEYGIETEHGNRHDPTQTFVIGPSLQVRPSRSTHVDMVAMLGTNRYSPDVEAYVVFGIDFGKVTGHQEQHGYVPASVSH